MSFRIVFDENACLWNKRVDTEARCVDATSDFFGVEIRDLCVELKNTRALTSRSSTMIEISHLRLFSLSCIYT